MNDGVNNEGGKTQSKTWSLAGCAFVGVVFGTVFSVLPMELVLLGAPLALGIGLLFCFPSTRRYRLSGYVPTIGIALTVMVCAGNLSPKRIDQPVDTFPSTVVTLEELVHRGIVYDLLDPAWASVSVALPTARPSQRQILDCINQQTQLRASVFRCASGATLLLGSSVGRISIRPSPKLLAQAKP